MSRNTATAPATLASSMTGEHVRSTGKALASRRRNMVSSLRTVVRVRMARKAGPVRNSTGLAIPRSLSVASASSASVQPSMASPAGLRKLTRPSLSKAHTPSPRLAVMVARRSRWRRPSS